MRADGTHLHLLQDPQELDLAVGRLAGSGVSPVDRRPLRSLRVTRPVSATVGGTGWHLVGIDVVRADRGLRVEVTSP